MRKNMFAFIVLAVFCVIASGGCGGGGSSGGGSVADNNGNQNTPEIPDNPSTETTYDFSILEGSWTASSGSGTATGTYGTFELRMVHVNASFSNVQANGNTATAIASTSAEWEAYQNGTYITSIYSDNNQEAIEIQHVNGNTWRYTFPSGNTLTLNITSATTANVTEEGTTSDGYRYTASYSVTKDSPNSPTTYDISTLQGTWKFLNGGGSATGNGGNYELVPSSLGTITISNLQANGNTLTGNMMGTLYWNVYQNGTQVLRAGLQYNRLEAQLVSQNTWRSSDGNSTMTITSQSTVSIREKGTFVAYGYPYQYDIVYTLTKQ